MAAFALNDTNERLIDIALKYGYDSQQTFARAFKSYFGISPGRYRENGVELPTLLTTIADPDAKRNSDQLNYEVMEIEELSLTGLSYSTDIEREQKDPAIAKVRDRFYDMLCRCSYIPRHHRCFDYSRPAAAAKENVPAWTTFIGIDLAGYVPQGLRVETIPASLYLLFVHIGGLDRLGDTIRKIEEHPPCPAGLEINRGYTLCIYRDRVLGDYFRPGIPVTHLPYDRSSDKRFHNDYRVDICIPVRKTAGSAKTSDN